MGGTYLSQNLWPKVFCGSLSSAGGLSETRTQTSDMQYWKHQYFLLVMIFNNQTSVLLLSNILYQYGPILTDQALAKPKSTKNFCFVSDCLIDHWLLFSLAQSNDVIAGLNPWWCHFVHLGWWLHSNKLKVKVKLHSAL